MTTIDLKNQLIEKINSIEDVKFLTAIKTIIDSRASELYVLSEEQKEGIAVGKQQIKDGNFFKNEDVFTELKEWIKNK